MDRPHHDDDAADLSRPGPSGRDTVAPDPDAPGGPLAEESAREDGDDDAEEDTGADDDWPEPNEPA